ncbi:hypothetical protein ACFFHH_06625 [Cytobacillus solani]|uniref:Uncharacterized protein n=1 Tax=Cytobacillus solani TaxID=1637975 RepID=A0A0Q3QQH3_9BACI|nr:hypothetical protein [Cytobacillus solani]KOP82950.1 hypothetical protein AMS60_11005 [Bacillus sp. FJAT-21945]KQL19974.1 hypothetical protein AN957_16310 [Cytobacillus solani]
MTSNSEGTVKQFLNNQSAMTLVESLLKNEDSLNYSALMNMANKLLNDETLMELVGEIGNSPDEMKEEQDLHQQEDQKLYVLQKQIEAMNKELTKTKQELASLKKQDTSIITLGMKVIHAASQDLKKGVNILTGVRNLLK